MWKVYFSCNQNIVQLHLPGKPETVLWGFHKPAEALAVQTHVSSVVQIKFQQPQLFESPAAPAKLVFCWEDVWLKVRDTVC